MYQFKTQHMKQYFITINAYQTKNKAHEELQNLLRQYDNCLIDEQRLQQLLEDLKHHIIFINNKYTRCQDIKSGSSSFTHGHSSFYVEGNFHMSIVQVKRFEFSDQEGVTR